MVMSVFLFGFAQAFYVSLESKPDCLRFLHHLKLSFSAMIGNVSLEEYEQAPFITVTMAVVFAIVCILLLNLLIAMMGSTYERVNEEAVGWPCCCKCYNWLTFVFPIKDLQWLLQRASSKGLAVFE